MIELMIQLVVGSITLILGYLVGKKGKIGLIHDYHYKRVKEEDKIAYTAMVGRAISAIGCGVVLCGLFNYITDSENGLIGLIVCIIYGLLQINKAQKLYNEGKWFS